MRQRLVQKSQLTVGVNDAYVEPAIQAILGAARTGEGEVGDTEAGVGRDALHHREGGARRLEPLEVERHGVARHGAAGAGDCREHELEGGGMASQ